MPLTTTCKYCQHPIRFEKEDIGFEVYCNSCGRPQVLGAATAADQPEGQPAEPDPAIEAAQSATPTSETSAPIVTAGEGTRKVSVFAPQAAAAVEQQVVAEETCLCGAKVPVRVEDYGGTVYCPACSTEIQVGQTLDGPKYLTARRTKTEAAGSLPTPAEKPRRRWLRSPLVLAALLLVCAVALSGAYLGSQHPDVVAGFWEQATATSGSADADNSPGDESAAESPDAAESAAPQKAPAPPSPLPQGPPHLAEFRALLDALFSALKAGRQGGHLAAAQKALAAADACLQAHKESLAPYSRRLLVLKARLREQEVAVAGAAEIHRLLDEAARAAAKDQVTRAIESQANARFLALRLYATEDETRQLEAKDRRVVAQVLLARGKRAVADAQRCQRAGDIPRRDQEVRRAFALLSGLPESQINPILEEIRPWQQQIELEQRRNLFAEKPPPTRPPAVAISAIARQIERRDRYETVVELHGRAKCRELVEACLRLQEILDNEAESQQARTRMETLLFDALELQAARTLKMLASAAEEEPALRELSEIRGALDRAQPWRKSYRWLALDATVARPM